MFVSSRLLAHPPILFPYRETFQETSGVGGFCSLMPFPRLLTCTCIAPPCSERAYVKPTPFAIGTARSVSPAALDRQPLDDGALAEPSREPDPLRRGEGDGAFEVVDGGRIAQPDERPLDDPPRAG